MIQDLPPRSPSDGKKRDGKQSGPEPLAMDKHEAPTVVWGAEVSDGKQPVGKRMGPASPGSDASTAQPVPHGVKIPKAQRHALEKRLNMDHLYTGLNLAQAKLVVKKFREAETIIEETRRGYEKKTGPKSQFVAYCLVVRANIYRDREDYQPAERLYQQAFDLLHGGEATMRSDLTEVAMNYAKLLDATNRDDEARQMREKYDVRQD